MPLLPSRSVRVYRRVSRPVIRRILKDVPVDKNVHYLVYLCYILFLKQLADESREKAFQYKTNYISTIHLMAVMKKVLKKFHG